MKNYILKKICQTLIWFFTLVSLSAYAGSFFYSPLDILLSKTHPIEVAYITNDGFEPALVQLICDSDECKQTIVFNPPLFKIASHEVKPVQIGLRDLKQRHNKKDYKLIIKELAPKVKNKNQIYFAISFAIHVSVLN